ncbi:B3 DNA binding domain-containing protein [Hirschfeldia incana]|nr:B3 DNA binding domain-containing protein [Hirschfeldia incana]
MGYYLMERKGWEKFLNDNHLGDDEFLTFTNDGKNCITVDIFQKNCIEILKPLKEEMSCADPVIAESKKKKKVDSDVYGASSSSAATFSLTIKKSNLILQYRQTLQRSTCQRGGLSLSYMIPRVSHGMSPTFQVMDQSCFPADGGFWQRATV